MHCQSTFKTLRSKSSLRSIIFHFSDLSKGLIRAWVCLVTDHKIFKGLALPRDESALDTRQKMYYCKLLKEPLQFFEVCAALSPNSRSYNNKFNTKEDGERSLIVLSVHLADGICTLITVDQIQSRESQEEVQQTCIC